MAPGQVEGREFEYIRFSILARKLLKRGNIVSVADLKTKVLAFVDYFNRTTARS